MYYIKFLSLIIILIFFNSCNTMTEFEEIYNITTINNMNIDDFIKNKPIDYKYPLQIKIKKSDSTFKGSVVFMHLGERYISRNCTSNNCFIIDTKGELDPVEMIVFSQLEITDSFIKGMYVFTGQTLDAADYSFKAEK